MKSGYNNRTVYYLNFPEMYNFLDVYRYALCEKDCEYTIEYNDKINFFKKCNKFLAREKSGIYESEFSNKFFNCFGYYGHWFDFDEFADIIIDNKFIYLIAISLDKFNESQINRVYETLLKKEKNGIDLLKEDDIKNTFVNFYNNYNEFNDSKIKDNVGKRYELNYTLREIVFNEEKVKGKLPNYCKLDEKAKKIFNYIIDNPNYDLKKVEDELIKLNYPKCISLFVDIPGINIERLYSVISPCNQAKYVYDFTEELNNLDKKNKGKYKFILEKLMNKLMVLNDGECLYCSYFYFEFSNKSKIIKSLIKSDSLNQLSKLIMFSSPDMKKEDLNLILDHFENKKELNTLYTMILKFENLDIKKMCDIISKSSSYCDLIRFINCLDEENKRYLINMILMHKNEELAYEVLENYEKLNIQKNIYYEILEKFLDFAAYLYINKIYHFSSEDIQNYIYSYLNGKFSTRFEISEETDNSVAVIFTETEEFNDKINRVLNLEYDNDQDEFINELINDPVNTKILIRKK